MHSPLNSFGYWTLNKYYYYYYYYWTGVCLLLDAATLSSYFPGFSADSCYLHPDWLWSYNVPVVFFILRSNRISRLDGDNSKKIVFENMYLFAASIVSVLIWKGLWMVLVIYEVYFFVFYHGFDITIWLGHFCSFLILAMARVSNTLLVKACERDGKFHHGKGVTFNTDYFRELIGDMESVWPKPNQ